LAEIFPFEVSLFDIFDQRTVARLSQHLEEQGTKHGADAGEICRMLQMIEDLSEEEIAARIAGGEAT